MAQRRTTVKGAYDVLVSMAIISYFIPYLFMFASMIRLQGEPAGPEVIRVPGGRPVAVGMAAVGFTTTAISIVLALIPAEDEPDKILTVTKVAGAHHIAGCRRRTGVLAGSPGAGMSHNPNSWSGETR
jgi:glutamate:GABA antiporter